ncbi:type II toxin-antitoxin system HicB family antitoxin [Methylocapsa sp. S129]|uniref:type II toxin-antitoxin system HicB family antitoxin n=1 Tax=Methylocapsa sp. S129 TaxID=1641869 RepID=UPI00131E055B|nr:type II toxin-antitoxin system HicB family antitoxin [Methylocapsa sp. S129]
MTDYVGIIDESEGNWGVRFPDLPGCYGAGVSADDAIRDAASAAREWIEHQTIGAKTLPPARTAADILASGDIDIAAGEAAVIIPVMIDDGRTVRANLTFDAGLLRAIDAAANQRGLTRSGFLASAAREKIAARR